MCIENARQPDPVTRWLNNQGLRFNPFQFEYLDASSDPHLLGYLVGNVDAIGIALAGRPTLIYAPLGGGKTALRVSSARSCWVGAGTSHAFPVPYVLTRRLHASAIHRQHSAVDHTLGLARATADSMLNYLVMRPTTVLALRPEEQNLLLSCLAQAIPSLPLVAQRLRDADDARDITEWHDMGFVLTDGKADPADLRAFSELLAKAAPATSGKAVESILDCLFDLILGTLKFRSIWLLVDGVDGFASTHDNAQSALSLIQPLMAAASAWDARKVRTKLFLPESIREPITNALPALINTFATGSVTWSPGLLAEMIRRRLYVASDGRVGGLDVLAAPSLRDVESQLLSAVPELPREAIFITGLLLAACASRTGGADRPLMHADIQTAIARYRRPNSQQDFESVAIPMMN